MPKLFSPPGSAPIQILPEFLLIHGSHNFQTLQLFGRLKFVLRQLIQKELEDLFHITSYH